MKAYSAEFFGTMILVLMGCGSAVLAATHIGFVGVSLSFGLALLALVYTLGPISGCHLNPAVTIGLAVSQKFEVRQVPAYIGAQVAGAIVASIILYIIASGTGHFDAVASGFASNGYGDRSPDHYGLLAAIVCEIVMTAILVLTILGSTDIRAPVGFAGLAIGLVLTGIHLVSIPVTNTSVNPARSIGPALFAGSAAILQLWVFIIAPIIGAVLAALVYRTLRAVDPVAQLSAKEATQALVREQEQRLERATTGVTSPAQSPEEKAEERNLR